MKFLKLFLETDIKEELYTITFTWGVISLTARQNCWKKVLQEYSIKDCNWHSHCQITTGAIVKNLKDR